MSKTTSKNSIKELENKILCLRKEKIFFQKKLADTQKSRDTWKQRFKDLRDQSNVGGTMCMDELFSGKSAKGYQYQLSLVLFCLQVQTFGHMSLRGVVHVLLCLQLCLGKGLGKGRLPCASTIRMWACKLGKWRIGRAQGAELGKWVYWVDESIHIGGEKVLLILGKRVSACLFERAFCLHDMTVLYMSASSQWTGEQIAVVLEQLNTTFPIERVISDMGGNLQKAYALQQLTHTPDVTHTLSKIMERLYASQPTFLAFTAFTSTLRKKWVLCKDKKAYLPPAQRTKARFANLFPLVEWANKMVQQWHTIPAELQEALDFIHTNRVWIQTFVEIQQSVIATSKILKNRGYNARMHRIIVGLMQRTLKSKTSTEQQAFSAQVTNYLQLLQQQISHDPNTTIACCSDIIESAFGKMKQKLAKSSTPHLTEFMFTLANTMGNITTEELKQALENTRDKDIKNNKNEPKKCQKTPHFSTDKKAPV
jgi:hypothetical protein